MGHHIYLLLGQKVILAIWLAASLSCRGDSFPTSVIGWTSYGTETYPDLTNAVAITAGGSGGLVLTQDGQIVPLMERFDSDIVNALPPNLSNIVMISAGDDHGAALHADGSLTFWGTIPDTNTPPALTNLLSIDCGWGSNLGLLADGRVALWGFWYIDTSYPPELTNVVDVSAGHRHFVGLRGDGTVVTWGDTNMGATLVPPGLSNVTAISCGAYHTLALRGDGTVVAWGAIEPGLTNVPAEATNVVAIAAGYHHNLVLRSDGRAVVWGNESVRGPWTNYVSEFSNVVAIAAGDSYSLALLSSNGLFPAPRLTAPRLQQGMLRFQVPTLRGRRYFVEDTADLTTRRWQGRPAFAGSGAPRDLTIACGTNAQKHVRVRSQQ
jgi:alpha-tubulin suppressor-like RCC1 family protein